MSEKKVKQARKEEGNQLLFKAVITVLKNGNIQIQGFPSSLRASIKFVSDINEALMMYFIEAARKGELDLKGQIIKSPIIMPFGVGESPCKVPLVEGKTLEGGCLGVMGGSLDD